MFVEKVSNCFETPVPWGPLNLALVWRFCKLVEARYVFGKRCTAFIADDLTVLPCRRSYQILRWLISASSTTALMIQRRWNSVGTLWELGGNCVQVQLELAVMMSLNRTSRQSESQWAKRYMCSGSVFSVAPQANPEIQWGWHMVAPCFDKITTISTSSIISKA